MQVYDLKTPDKYQPGQIIDIPVSFGIFVKGSSKRYTSGFVKAEFVKYVDEFRANEFAFRLGVGDTRQARHKAFFSVHDNKRDVIMVAEQGFDLFAFIHAQQAMVNKDASQLRADRLVNEDCGHGAIDAAR